MKKRKNHLCRIVLIALAALIAQGISPAQTLAQSEASRPHGRIDA